MPDWLIGQAGELGGVVAKALLMYLVALIGLRLAHRRTLAQWTAIDFAAAVAVGAILGRTAVASGQSFLVGAAALLTVLAAHTAVTYARFRPWVVRATEHRVRVLVDHGELRRDQLRLCGLTDGDLVAQLRQQGVGSLADLRYVLYEAKGELTVVREPGPGTPDADLVHAGLSAAAGYRPAG
jgi:uncharacterized membrane protein YcaP (DUF421 family)